VRLDYLTNPYWAKRFDGIRRVAGPAAAPAPFDTPSYQAATPQSPERVAPVVARAAPAYAGAGAGGMAAVTAGEASSAGAGVGEAPSTGYAAELSQAHLSSQQPAVRVATTPRASSTTAAQPTSAAPVTTAGAPGAQADPFEPPPTGLTAAQMQAHAAGAVAPTMAPAAQASAYAPPAAAPEQTATAVRAAPQNPAARAPDAIDAAADAFEPPPPASVAARQAQQAQQADANGGVQIMRASTASRGMPAPSQTNDDPIARFANGNY
jgi:hypothetical protein